MKKIILILVVLVIAALILPVAVLAAPIGKITALEGKVDMTPAGAKDAVPVAVGVSVNAGDILRAKSKSKAEITFPDGNILRLAENTRVRVTQYQPEQGKTSYVNLFRGKTVAVVDKLKKGSNFEVHTPTAICGVRGTVFYSSYQSGQSSFVFQSGTGYGYNINRPDQVVAIPPKVFMVIQGADKAPLLRPATDVEIDKHQKDTTLSEKPKEEGKKEEEKKSDGLKSAKDEGKPKEEKKEERAKTDKPGEEGKAKGEDKNGGKPPAEDAKQVVASANADKNEKSGSVDIVARDAKTDQGAAKDSGTTSGSATSATSAPTSGTVQAQSSLSASSTSDAASLTINQVLLTEKQPIAQTTLLITTTPVTQPTKTETIVQKDNTPPDVSFSSGPASLTNMQTATFNYNANEKVDYQYKLDTDSGWTVGPSSTQSGSTTLNHVPEGSRTLTIKATDSGGNVTNTNYSWTTDYTAPNVSISSKPKSITNQNSATFNYSADKTIQTYSYRTDGGAWVDTTDQSVALKNLSEASHNFEITATDKAGNVSNQQTYGWTTDYTAPTLSATPQATSPKGNRLADVEISLNSDKNATYEYTLDGGAYTATGATLTVSDLSVGDHTVTTRATDEAGNISDEQTTSFNLSNRESSGKSWATGDMTSSNTYLTVAGVTNESWGSWKITDNGAGTPPSSWNYYAGNANDASGTPTDQISYWLQKASGTASNGNISGTSSEITYLNRNVLGTGANGSVDGSYGGSTWSLTDTGRGLYTETPLSFWGNIRQGDQNDQNEAFYFVYWDNANKIMKKDDGNYMTGMLGGTEDLWSGTPSFTALGSYYNPGGRSMWKFRFDDSKGSLSDATNDGQFRGKIMGIGKPDGSIEGSGYGLYIKNPASGGAYEAGYLSFNDVTGNYFSGISMWKATGTVAATTKGTTTYSPDQINSAIQTSTVAERIIYGEGGNITGSYKRVSYNIDGQDWGVIGGGGGGVYAGTIPQDWTANAGNAEKGNDGYYNNYVVHKIQGSAWSEDRIAATDTGNMLNWTYKVASSNGKLLGNSNASTGTWQAGLGSTYDRTPLKFASLIGNWTDDSRNRTGVNLTYARMATGNPQQIGTTANPIRIVETRDITSANLYAFSYVPPTSLDQKYSVITQLKNRTGNNKSGNSRSIYSYPYAYINPTASNQDTYNIYHFLFQKGDTYFAVYDANGASTTLSAAIYKRTQSPSGWIDDTLPITGSNVTSGTLTSSNPWWYGYKITAAADPAEAATIYLLNQIGSVAPGTPEFITNDGSITGIMGGTTSLIQNDQTADIPIRLMGEYTKSTAKNRMWRQELVPWENDVSKYITLDADPGTYVGSLGGILRPEQKKTEGLLSAIVIKPTGEAGILQGSFGTGSDAGVIYPNLLAASPDQDGMWEADGKVSRYDLNVASGITPSTLPASRWWFLASPYTDTRKGWSASNDYISRMYLTSYDERNYSWNGGWGIFANNDLSKFTDDLTFRQDYFDAWKLAKDTDNTFGVWNWRATGKYKTTDAKWFMGAWMYLPVSYETPTNVGNYNSQFSTELFANGDAWQEGQFTGQVKGYFGDGGKGFTGVMAGNLVGSYQDNPPTDNYYDYATFIAYSTGSWLNTKQYLAMVDDTTAGGGREKLLALGYPTETYANTASLPGTLATDQNYALQIGNIRFYNSPNTSFQKLMISDGLASADGTGFETGVRYAITSASDDRPAYGTLTSLYKSDSSTPTTWLGRIRGLGVFEKTDGTLTQGSFQVFAAGTSTTGQKFSGTLAGDYEPTSAISVLSPNSDERLYFKHWDGSSLQNAGYLKGLLGSQSGPSDLEILTDTPTSTKVSMVGMWSPEGELGNQSHIFASKIYPKNFETTDPSQLYTTTKGSSYWGSLAGIHRYISGSSSEDGLEAIFSAVLVDKNKNAGMMFGKIGGPENESDNAWTWGFDRTTKAFGIDTNGDSGNAINVIKMGVTTSTTAANLKNVMEQDSQKTVYSFQGSVDAAYPGIVGYLLNGNGDFTGNFYMTAHDTPSPQNMTHRWLPDFETSDLTKPGIWGGGLAQIMGSYDNSNNTQRFYGEIQTPDSTSPTKWMGANLYGSFWQDNRIQGGAIGYWADISHAMAATGVSMGNILGTFNPSDSYTYQAILSTGFMETNRYLEATLDAAGRESLRAMNVPCISVGQVNMTGANGDLSVNMNNVKFFAYSTGAAPSIWATNSVQGNYGSTSPLGRNVPLTGGGLSADFTMKTWDTTNSKWLATVSNGAGSITAGSSGHVSGSGTNVQNLNFRGAAAGNITSSTAFSGTGAGVAKQVKAQ